METSILLQGLIIIKSSHLFRTLPFYLYDVLSSFWNSYYCPQNPTISICYPYFYTTHTHTLTLVEYVAIKKLVRINTSDVPKLLDMCVYLHSMQYHIIKPTWRCTCQALMMCFLCCNDFFINNNIWHLVTTFSLFPIFSNFNYSLISPSFLLMD